MCLLSHRLVCDVAWKVYPTQHICNRICSLCWEGHLLVATLIPPLLLWSHSMDHSVLTCHIFALVITLGGCLQKTRMMTLGALPHTISQALTALPQFIGSLAVHLFSQQFNPSVRYLQHSHASPSDTSTPHSLDSSIKQTQPSAAECPSLDSPQASTQFSCFSQLGPSWANSQLPQFHVAFLLSTGSNFSWHSQGLSPVSHVA